MSRVSTHIKEIIEQSSNVVYKAKVYRSLAGKAPSQYLHANPNLSASEQEQEAIAQALIDFATPSQFSSTNPHIDRPFEQAEYEKFLCDIDFDGVFNGPIANCGKSRFSPGGSFGVWYGAKTEKTCLIESLFRWLDDCLLDYGSLEYLAEVQKKVITAVLDAVLVDLRMVSKSFKELVDPKDYTLTQALGEALHRDVAGLQYFSARHSRGVCLGVFRADGLSSGIYLRHVEFSADVERNKAFITGLDGNLIAEVSIQKLVDGKSVSF